MPRAARGPVWFTSEWMSAHVVKHESGCWLFNGLTERRGPARRFYERFVGPITDGLFVLHRCDVKGCVNPRHLELGTHRDNMAQMVARGRAAERFKNPRYAKQGRRIQRAREAAKLSRADFGMLLGMGRYYSSISKWERGFVSPRDEQMKTIVAILTAFGAW